MNSRREWKEDHVLESLESRVLLSTFVPHATTKTAPPPPPVSRIVITQQPKANIQAGAISLMTVKLEDSTGKVVTSAKDKVNLQIVTGPSSGNLFGTLTVNAVNGVATFNAFSFGKIGTYKLKAVDGKISSGSSQAVNVTLGPAAKVKIVSTFPTNAQRVPSGAIGPIVVDVIDAGGNIINAVGTQKFNIVSSTSTSSGWIESAPFTLGERVTQAGSAATGTVVAITTGTNGSITVNVLSGAFNNTNVITGGTSHSTLTPTGSPTLATVPTFSVTAVLNTSINTATTAGTVSQVANGTANTTNGVATINLAGSNGTTTSNTTNGPSSLGLKPGYYNLTVTATSNSTSNSTITLVSQTLQVHVQ